MKRDERQGAQHLAEGHLRVLHGHAEADPGLTGNVTGDVKSMGIKKDPKMELPTIYKAYF